MSERSRVVHLHAPAVFRPADGHAAASFLARVCGVREIRSIRVDFRSGTAAMHYEDGTQPAVVLDKLAAALTGAEPPVAREQLAKRLFPLTDDVVTLYRCGGRFSTWRVLVSGRGVMRVCFNLSLAGASFALAIVGVTVPGIPTVPFLLSTSYFLVRSSPRLNERLLASRTFGGLLRDWQQHGGMRRRVKVITVAVMLVVATLTILTAQLSTVMLVVVLLLMAVGVWMVLRTPTISDSPCPTSLART